MARFGIKRFKINNLTTEPALALLAAQVSPSTHAGTYQLFLTLRQSFLLGTDQLADDDRVGRALVTVYSHIDGGRSLIFMCINILSHKTDRVELSCLTRLYSTALL